MGDGNFGERPFDPKKKKNFITIKDTIKKKGEMDHDTQVDINGHQREKKLAQVSSNATNQHCFQQRHSFE
jgi:hypothetical protein